MSAGDPITPESVVKVVTKHEKLLFGYWDDADGRGTIRVKGVLEQMSDNTDATAQILRSLKKRDDDETARIKEIKSSAWSVGRPLIGVVFVILLVQVARWVADAAPLLIPHGGH